MRSAIRAAVMIIGMAILAGVVHSQEESWPPPGDIEWDGVYDGKTLPGEAVPSWRDSTGVNTEAKIDEGGLRVVDKGTEQGNLLCYYHGWRAIAGAGALVEASVKLNDNSGRAGAHIMAADGVHEASLSFYRDKIAVTVAGDEELVYAMDTTDAFHVYRLAVRGEDLQVWVDDKPAVDGQGRFTRPAHAGRNQVRFGSCSSAAQSDAVYAYVKYKVFGERPPLPPRISGVEDVVIYKTPGVYSCFPSLMQAEDGTLYTSFGTRARRSHIDSTGGSARMMSKDQGRTWQPLDGPIPTDPFTKCEDGGLVMATAHGWRNIPAERKDEFAKQGITVMDVRPGVVAYLQGAMVRRSSDSGKTWTEQELQLPAHKSLMVFNSGARCKLENGVRLVAVYGKLLEDEVSRVFVLRSADDGKTWWFLPLAADHEGKVNLNETAIIDNGRGEVIAMIRSEPPGGGYLYTSSSTDGGITWSPTQESSIWGYPAHLLRLADGRILCTYGYRRDDMGVRAVISTDGGHTWDTDNTVILRNDAAPYGSDLGYPLSVETAPGKVFTIYYFTGDDDITHIAGTHWTVPPARNEVADDGAQ